jgi:ABC-2 type transport system permease protein
MFLHIFKYRLKCLFGGRAEVFWTLIYPIVLATFFSLAFSNLSNVGKFAAIDIAVVDNEEYRSNVYFKTAIGAVSDRNDNAVFLTLR